MHGTQWGTSDNETARLAWCTAVFEAGDPPRTGQVAFWDPDDGELPAVRLPVEAALPVLRRARRSGQAHPTTVFWGEAVDVALHVVAQGRILPGVSAGDFDAWRVGPLDAADVERIRELAAAMPAEARTAPVPPHSPFGLPDAHVLMRAFLDAIADSLPRTPAAVLAAGGPAFAAVTPQRVPELRRWAHEVAVGVDTGVRISLRLEILGLEPAGGDLGAASFLAVVQLHSLADPTLVTDARDLWRRTDEVDDSFGAQARIDTMLAVRRAARVWAPLERLLAYAVPDELALADEDVEELLGEGSMRLAAAGVEVHWPRELARDLTASAVVRAPGVGDPRQGVGDPNQRVSDPRAHFGDLLSFDWQLALRGEPLSQAEMELLAQAHRPVVRLREQWILVDPDLARKARERELKPLRATEALGLALAGSTAIALDRHSDGKPVEVSATGWLDALRERISDPDGGEEPLRQPAALRATLRDYQLRGLRWLARMTSLGLGACLADDMGLGKTITLIALHLHRQADPATAGPTLVVCPASLLGNWEREIGRFAPGTAVRRFHGPGRSLGGATDGFVLTTYGTMRLDADRLGAHCWGMVVADEAQHVKNPLSGTAKALRVLSNASERDVARVALTGTPVENNLSELWAILDWTTPGVLGTLTAFRTRWAAPVEDAQDSAAGAGGRGDAAERLSRLVRPFLLRRRKSDPGIAPELPPKTETDQPVALTREQVALYEAVVRETMEQIRASSGLARRGLVLKLLTALKQVCNHPAQYLKETHPQLTGRSGKLELLDELLDTIIAEDGAVLVFTQYVTMARLIERHLGTRGLPAQLLHGGTSVQGREDMVQRFQDGGVPVFLLSLKAGGTGLNLTRADHVIHYDRWWNPAVEEQATDRAYRIGQTRPVQVHRLIAEGTVEDRIATMLRSKRELADAVLGSGEAALTELSDTDLADLVELRDSVIRDSVARENVARENTGGRR